jgi:HD-GYP domain-containing protein (c-di-GMP phosphodiesterase class II)
LNPESEAQQRRRRSRTLRQDGGVPARLRLADVLAGLSVACDLGFGLPPETAMRSCVIATGLAREVGLPDDEVSDTYYASLLFHSGCPAFSHETAALFGNELTLLGAVAKTNIADPDDWTATLLPEATRGMPATARERFADLVVREGPEFGRQFDVAACEVASAVARRVGLGDGVQRALAESVEWWNGTGPPAGLRGDDIALPARIARAAADAGVLAGWGGLAAAVDGLRARAGTVLDPSVVAAFGRHAPRLVAEASDADVRARVLELEPEPSLERPAGELREIAAAFGDAADLKVPALHGHSAGVAGLATDAAQRLRVDARTVGTLEVAALLHDLGRLAISNVVWEKPAALTPAEREQVRLHAYHSERILARSAALEPAARVAGMHHERLDGSGYHRSSAAREQPVAVRILAAADAFQAMTQPRAHRAARTGEEAAGELRRESAAGRLDADCVAAVLEAAGAARPGRRRDLRPAGLSEREIEVLRLVAEGLSNAEIAGRLVISRRTAEHHVQHVYAKVGVASRAAVALFALEHGLLDGAG